jgi:hypothetical protein
MALTTDVCSNRALPGPSQQATPSATLQFASIFNLYTVYGRGIGGNYSNVDMATNSSELLKNGLQVMVLTPTGALDTKATKPVVLSLVEQPSSPGIPWGRTPKLNGIKSVVPIMGVASFGELGVSTSGKFRFRACVDAVCALSPVIAVEPDDVAQAVILAQPPKGTEFPLWNPKTASADFANATGPINATFSDYFENNGVQAELFGSGLVEANVTCQVATEAAPDANDYNPISAKVVNSVQAIWTPTGYAEFWSFGKLREGIDSAFGPGTVAGALSGFRCWAEIQLGDGFREEANETASAQTDYWLFK